MGFFDQMRGILRQNHLATLCCISPLNHNTLPLQQKPCFTRPSLPLSTDPHSSQTSTPPHTTVPCFPPPEVQTDIPPPLFYILVFFLKPPNQLQHLLYGWLTFDDVFNIIKNISLKIKIK
uniref:Uncharacterized protein n=1 Tax=Cacopsylla melanoneura TaxID=428564 RepID=A0A8D8T369_9HEMI